MKIKTMLQILFLLSVLISASVVSLVIVQKNKMGRMIEKEMLTNEIIRVISQREKIINNYINDHQDENIMLWQLMYEITAKLLQSDAFETQDEQTVLESMREDNVAINKLVTEIIISEQGNQSEIKGNTSNQPLLNKFKSSLIKLGCIVQHRHFAAVCLVV